MGTPPDTESMPDLDNSSAFKYSSRRGKSKHVVIVDESHPFELEAYIAGYKGRTVIQRLLHIASNCPTLAPAALRMAINNLHGGRDHVTYSYAMNAYNNLPSIPEHVYLDGRYVEDARTRNAVEKNKLEVELKTYTSNMIKESIRMAHRDLGDYFRSVNEGALAMKHYTKSREFCSTSQHVLDMCISILELLIEQQNYSHIVTYVYKAEAALDIAPSSAVEPSVTASTGSMAAGSATAKRGPGRDKMQPKLELCNAFSYLGQGNYEKAAVTFLALPVKGLDDWVGKVVTASDIAIYGSLCSLASFPRSAIASALLKSESFGYYLEQEPYMRELLDAYMSSKFKTVLELLDRYSSRHLLDIHLNVHVHELTTLIRNRALVLYFQPFASIRLDRMGEAFGMSLEEVEGQVVSLIQSGDIKGRVDSQNKILRAKDQDTRAALYEKVVQTGADMKAANRKLLLRMRLLQAELVVKAPKNHQSQHLEAFGD